MNTDPCFELRAPVDSATKREFKTTNVTSLMVKFLQGNGDWHLGSSPDQFKDRVKDILQAYNHGDRKAAPAIRSLLNTLPPSEFQTLKVISHLMNEIAQRSDTNKMTPPKLALCVGGFCGPLAEFMFSMYDEIFG